MKVDENYIKISSSFEFSTNFESKKNIKNKFLNFCKKFFSFIKNLFIIIIIIINIYLYHSSLAGCELNSQYECLKNKMMKFYYSLIYKFLFSVIIDSIIFLLSIHKIISIFYSIFLFIQFLMFSICFTGYDFQEHGSYNTIFLVIVFIIVTFFFEIFFWLNYCRKFENKKIFYFWFIFVSVPFVLLFMSKINGCKDWNKGLGNVIIDNNKKDNNCIIIEPKNCWISPLSGIFDMSRIFCKKCSKLNKNSNYFNKLISVKGEKFKESFNFGFPNTKDYDFRRKGTFQTLTKNVQKDIFDLDDPENENKNPEIKLHFDKNKSNGKIEINVIKNETLIKERKEKINELNNETKKPLKYTNYLFLYIDSISRAHFFRALPKTAKLLEKFYFRNLKNKSKIKAYQFMKYMNFHPSTPLNTIPLFYGESFESENGIHINKKFHENGFITATSENSCTKELFDLSNEKDKNRTYVNFDHENMAMFCDPSFADSRKMYPFYRGPFSIIRRCLYGKETYEYVFEYGKKFLETYKNYPRKYLRLAFIDAHEGTGEVVKRLDESFKNFLEYYIKNHFTNQTAIIIASDHGNNMIGQHGFFNGDDWHIEKTLGMLFFLFPENEKFDFSGMVVNEQRFITTYDIYNTFMEMLGYDEKYYNKKGKSLFDAVDGNERDCFSYDDWYNRKGSCQCVSDNK